jgi:hypothetical protein
LAPSLEKPLPKDDPNAFAKEESPPDVENSHIPPGLEPRLRNPEDVPFAPGADEALEPVDVVVAPSICFYSRMCSDVDTKK